MRETKFRGKVIGKQEELEAMGVIDKNGWATGNLIQNEQHTMIVGDLLEFDDEDMMCDWWVPVIPETVEQIKADLNEDQQIVLDWMKKELTNWGVNDLFFELAFLSFDGGLIKNEITARAYRDLADIERLQVLKAFAEWGLSQND